MSKNTGKYNKNKLKTLQGGNHEEIKKVRNLEPQNFPKNKKGVNAWRGKNPPKNFAYAKKRGNQDVETRRDVKKSY